MVDNWGQTCHPYIQSRMSRLWHFFLMFSPFLTALKAAVSFFNPVGTIQAFNKQSNSNIQYYCTVCYYLFVFV